MSNTNECKECGASPAWYFKLFNKVLCKVCYSKHLVKWIFGGSVIGGIIYLISTYL